MKQRIVSLLLVFCMVITLVPANVLADEVKGLAETTAGQTQTAGTTAAKPENPFADVKSGSWYEAAVLYARANGFFDGTSATTFEPEGSMTRAMFVTVLGRMAGVKAADYAGATDFSDVAEGTWYAPFVKWAARYGITTGTGNGKFLPDGKITREEMAVFFVRYFETFDAMPKADTTVTTKPADLDEVSSWAQDAVLKLWALGLLNGDGVNFAPKDKATRAQTAALCQRTDKAVETWYSEPGVKSERVSVEPGSGQETGDKKPEEQKPSGGGSSGGSAGGGTTTTTNYEVTFVVEGASMPNATVEAGTRISSLPTPTVEGKVFLGWYYDSALTRAAGANDTVNGNTTLYAKLGEVMAVNANEAETLNYVTVTVTVEELDSYTFGISGYAEGCIDSFINVTANNAEMKQTGDTAEPYRYTVSGTAVSPVLAQGQTYRVELTADSGACFVVKGAAQAPSVRVLNIITEKGPTDHLKLADGVKFLPASSVSNMTGTALDGLFTASAQSGSVEQNKNTGSFRYTGADLAAGDTVAIYSGTRPDQRTIATSGTSADGAVAYVEITEVSGDTYKYKTADSEDVLFTPDVLPVSVNADKVADDGNVLTVDKLDLTFTDDKYAEMGLDSQTTIDVGDYLALYTGDTVEGASEAVYGRITAVRETVLEETACYVIEYVTVPQDEVFAAMDLYTTRNEKVELSDEQRAEIEADMERQAIESGFVEEASQYLAALAMETDGFRELSDDLDMDLSSYSITYADGTPVSEGDMALMAGRAQITEKTVEATVAAGYVLQHFDGSSGVRAELAIRFKVDVGGKLEIVVQAIFEQEVLLSVNTSGGAIWKWKWIFPYIYDYQLNANLDLGTYTGIGITATAKTVGGEDEDFDWAPVTGNGAESKILNIGQQITELMEKKEEFLGQKLVDENGEEIEWNGTNGGSLADKYSAMMEDAEDNWVELFRREIFSKEGPVDKLHILVYGISADFVVSANVYVTLGMTFTYSTAKRYNFSLQLFHKQSTNQTIDLEKPNYNFDFYVMGTIGIRAGVEFEIGIGLFSLRLDSIGITAEAGAYARLWGYFYYHLSWEEGSGKDSSASGAMFVEIGLYLKITFKAQLFSSDKLTYQPTLYENEWPLWSAGAQENVYGFLDGGEDCNIVLTGQRTTGLPQDLFRMSYMDMKTGEQFGVLDDEGALEDEDKPAKLFGASSFTIDISNPKFRYDAGTNTVTVTPGESTGESCDIRIVWKNAPLAFTDRPISRTVHIEWSDPAEARYIAFDTRGGSLVPALSLRAGAAVRRPADPTRQGYDFAGWTADEAGTQPFRFPATMPDYLETIGVNGITVYAQWTPRNDTKYTVEHYRQTVTGSGYELAAEDTQTLRGTTEGMTAAAEKSYTGFRLKRIEQTTITPDGSAVAKVYYDRELYPVTFAYNVAGLEGNDMVYRVKYEGTVYPPRLTLGGYDFAGYEGLQTDENGGLRVTQAMRFNATWTPRTDTPYRVEHYTQAADGGSYQLIGGESAIESRTGETNASVGVSGLNWNQNGLRLVKVTADGAELDKETGSFVVRADGRTVVKLFYDRNEVTLTFDSKGGSAVSPIRKGYGLRITMPAAPTKAGYTFAGWYTDAACSAGREFAGRVMPDQDTTVYAKWTAGEYGITYVLNGGEKAEGSPDAFTYGTETVIPDPVRTGYDFAGWLVNGGETAQTGLTLGATEYSAPITLTATWTAQVYDIIYDMNGGENADGNPGRHTYGRETVISAPKARSGYAFAGWRVNGGENAQTALTLGATAYTAGPITLTATWTAGAQSVLVRHNVRRTDGTGYELITTTTVNAHTDDELTLAGLVSADVAVANGITYAYAEAGGTAAEKYTVPADGAAVIDLYYERAQYTLTWQLNGGTPSGEYTSGTVYYGAAITAPTLSKTGYDFAGWYADAAFTEAAPAAMPAHDLTVYAKWTASGSTAYRVEHYLENADTDGYALDDAMNTTGTTEETVTAEPKAYGAGIAYNAAASAASGTVAAGGSLVLRLYYDRVRYDVTLDANGGELTGAAERTLKFGQTLPGDAAARTDYAFLGWYESADTDGDALTAMPARDVTLYAKWSAGRVNYTVKHYYMGLDGSYADSADATRSPFGEVDSSAALDALKENKEGFTYADGSVYRIDGDTELTEANVRIEKNMVVSLRYSRDRYTLTWDLAGGTAASAYTSGEVYYGAAITAPVPSRTGYTYVWDAEPVTVMPAQDFRYTAVWTANRHDVVYKDGDTELSRAATAYGTEVTLDAAPTKAGYTFAGWSVSGAAVEDGRFTMPDADVTITAQWTANTYTVRFDANGGAGEMADQSLTYDVSATLTRNAFNKTGYAFNGWSTKKDGNGTSYADQGQIKNLTVENDGVVTLYAQWSTKRCTITFETGGGTRIDAITQGYGTDITAPADPTRVGYTFAGWDREIPSTMPAEDLTITAQWTAITYAIRYDLTGVVPDAPNKTVKDPQHGTYHPDSHTYGQVTPISDPTATGYLFKGWLVGSDTTPKMGLTLDANTVYTDPISLKATWKAIGYTVQFNANGGEGSMDAQSLTYDTSAALTANAFTRTGYTFNGWNTVANGSGTAYTDGQTVENLTAADGAAITLYAQWEAVTYSITYERKGGMAGEGCPDTYRVSDTTFQLGSPSRAGYEFLGWYTTPNFLASSKVTTLPGSYAQDLTLYAKWEELVWSLSYSHYDIGNGENEGKTYPTRGTATIPVTKTVSRGTSFELTPASAPGWVFLGWTTSTEEDAAIISGSDKGTVTYTPLGDTTFYAKWEHPQYTITYVLGSETTQTIAPVTNYYGKRVPLPVLSTVTAEGLKLLGWDMDGTVYNSDNLIYPMPEKDVTAKAIWGLGDIASEADFLAVAERAKTAKYTNNEKVWQNVKLTGHVSIPSGTQLDLSNFRGTLNGNNYMITIYNADTTAYKPLFGTIGREAVVGNVTILFRKNSVIADTSTLTKNSYWGIFAKAVNDGGWLDCCSVATTQNLTVNFTGMPLAEVSIGGLVGYNSGRIENCSVGGKNGNAGNYVTLEVAGTGTSAYKIGGLVGENWGEILYSVDPLNSSACVHTKTVVTGNHGNLWHGGLIGYMAAPGAQLEIEANKQFDVCVAYANSATQGTGLTTVRGNLVGEVAYGTVSRDAKPSTYTNDQSIKPFGKVGDQAKLTVDGKESTAWDSAFSVTGKWYFTT